MTVTRGTSNANQRGSSRDRAARRAYLLATYAANVQAIHWEEGETARLVLPDGPDHQAALVAWLADTGRAYLVLATTRCFRCGCLLVEDTLTVDRIKPGIQGGTYRRENIRPACGPCNSETGAKLARRKRRR